MRWIVTWLINTVALFALPYLMTSIKISSFGTALIAALILGLINTLVRPVLVLLTLPVTVLTLGLFIVVINGLMFWIVSGLVEGFEITSFWAAMGAAIMYSIISWALSTLILRK